MQKCGRGRVDEKVDTLEMFSSFGVEQWEKQPWSEQLMKVRVGSAKGMARGGPRRTLSGQVRGMGRPLRMLRQRDQAVGAQVSSVQQVGRLGRAASGTQTRQKGD